MSSKTVLGLGVLLEPDDTVTSPRLVRRSTSPRGSLSPPSTPPVFDVVSPFRRRTSSPIERLRAYCSPRSKPSSSSSATTCELSGTAKDSRDGACSVCPQDLSADEDVISSTGIPEQKEHDIAFESVEPVSLLASTLLPRYELYLASQLSTVRVPLRLSLWEVLDVDVDGWAILARSLASGVETEVSYYQLVTRQLIELPHLPLQLQTDIHGSHSTTPTDLEANITIVLHQYDPITIVLFRHFPGHSFWVAATLELPLGLDRDILADRQEIQAMDGELFAWTRTGHSHLWISDGWIHVLRDCDTPHLLEVPVYSFPLHADFDRIIALATDIECTSTYLIVIRDGLMIVYRVTFGPAFGVFYLHVVPHSDYSFFVSTDGRGWARRVVSYVPGQVYISAMESDVIRYLAPYYPAPWYDVIRPCHAPAPTYCRCVGFWFFVPTT